MKKFFLKRFFLIFYAIVLIIVAVLLLDVYGFIGDKNKTITIEIKENDSLNTIASAMHKSGIIMNKEVFKLFYKLNTNTKIINPGFITVNGKMAYIDLVRIINEPASSTVKVTIPEGFEVDEIIKRLLDNELSNENEFNYELRNFTYTFKNGVKISGEKYLMSGYLYPDTYMFYKTAKPSEIIWKLVKNFDDRWTDEYDEQAKKLKMSMEEVIILASIIEREARHEEDFPLVSSVFHNRLKIKKPLESCATVQYILQDRQAVLSIMNTRIESPYNTYKYAGLPPSPISCPGGLAIKSALFPAETNKYYFFTDKNGINHYSNTYAEHNEQIKKYGL